MLKRGDYVRVSFWAQVDRADNPETLQLTTLEGDDYEVRRECVIDTIDGQGMEIGPCYEGTQKGTVQEQGQGHVGVEPSNQQEGSPVGRGPNASGVDAEC